MTQTGARIHDPRTMERVMACPACKVKLKYVRRKLTGRTIKSVEFTNDVDSVGVVLHFDDDEEFHITTRELRLIELLRDPDIARQEQDSYYTTHAYRLTNRRSRKGAKAT